MRWENEGFADGSVFVEFARVNGRRVYGLLENWERIHLRGDIVDIVDCWCRGSMCEFWRKPIHAGDGRDSCGDLKAIRSSCLAGPPANPRDDIIFCN